MKRYSDKIDNLTAGSVEIRSAGHGISLDLDDVDARSFARGCSTDLLRAILCEIGEDKIKAIFAEVDAEEAAELEAV